MLKLLKRILKPKSTNEDIKRREFILNVLLFSAILLFSIAILVNTFVALVRPDSHTQSSLSFVFLFGILFLFLSLFYLSKKGKIKIATHVFIFLFFLLALFMSLKWGVDVNASLLLYALIIVMAGILEGTKFSFLITGLIALSLMVVGFLQANEIIIVNTYWRTEPWKGSDTLMTVLILLSVATVSWLSNREIEKSLFRARHSEELLKKERDQLEITVEKRTQELREAETEKISQLYRFAEFGRLSSGLFHDLMNPLSAVSLNMEKAKIEKDAGKGLEKAKQYLEQALLAASKMNSFIQAVRNQIAKKKELKKFSLVENIKEIIKILSYKAYLKKVQINFQTKIDPMVFGDEIKWNQIVLNLITNAIDAYEDLPLEEKIVTLNLLETEKEIIFSVSDQGIGILPEIKEKIFQPFFTTKNKKETEGIGIGLSMTKTMLEKDFKGKISFISKPKEGTTFFITLPK